MSDAEKNAKPKRVYTQDRAFQARFASALEQTPGVPEKVHGRLTWLSRAMAAKDQPVTTETVRKWAAGEATPRGQNLETLCDIMRVDPGWLSLGTTPVASRREIKTFAARVGGAVHYTLGRMLLDGVTAALPDADDEISAAASVDISAIIDGRMLRIAVSAARSDGDGLVVDFAQSASKNELLVVVPGKSPPDLYRVPTDAVPDHHYAERFGYRVYQESGSRVRVGGKLTAAMTDMRDFK